MPPNHDSRLGNNARRRWLAQAGALAAAGASPSWTWSAQSPQRTALSALPRHALVVGNARYAEAPLTNPANDARAMAAELQKLGFAVSLRLDAGRSEMIDAFAGYGNELARSGAVGVFYYAGHGAQLAWNNYLIPVDAAIDRIEDMQSKAVELKALLDNLLRAKNPMNVLILDACRDNPFGYKVRAREKGLAQFDAPPGSLLAYATSPGNTAADGDGANGLYTEQLLRELKVADARIEDVFKRVRLAVRRRSAGRQIPWESTLLEQDFYFVPPAQAGAPSAAELERSFAEELAIWERIRDARDPAQLEDYLRRYPSGKFSELAQFRLDRVLGALGEKNIEIAPAAGNPFTKGTARVNTNFKVGDSWTYRTLDLATRREIRTFRNRIVEITGNEVRFSSGLVTDLFGNILVRSDGVRLTHAQFYIHEYSVGKKWTTRYRSTTPDGVERDAEMNLKVTAREKVTVPAGTFDAFRVEREGSVLQSGVKLAGVDWLAAGINRPVALERLRTQRNGNVLESERLELVAYNQQ